MLRAVVDCSPAPVGHDKAGGSAVIRVTHLCVIRTGRVAAINACEVDTVASSNIISYNCAIAYVSAGDTAVVSVGAAGRFHDGPGAKIAKTGDAVTVDFVDDVVALTL